MEIIEVETAKLTPYDKNNRSHPREQIEEIAASIKEFGFDVPILITENNLIIAGHGRKLAAELLGLKKVPCIITTLNDVRTKARRIVDNTIPQGATSLLDNLVSEAIFLDEAGFNLSVFGLEKYLGELVSDPSNEWTNMPDFESEDQSSFKSLKVHFESEADVLEFSKLINQKITKNTLSIWYPYKEREKLIDRLYVSNP